jgi:hypothetical protein
MVDESVTLSPETTVESSQPRYEGPRLTLIGNLNDLLAGNASKNPDSGACTGAAGTDPTPC